MLDKSIFFIMLKNDLLGADKDNTTILFSLASIQQLETQNESHSFVFFQCSKPIVQKRHYIHIDKEIDTRFASWCKETKMPRCDCKMPLC